MVGIGFHSLLLISMEPIRILSIISIGVFKTHLRKLNTFWQLFLQYMFAWNDTFFHADNIGERVVEMYSIFSNGSSRLQDWGLHYIAHKESHFMPTILKEKFSKCIQFSQMGLEDSIIKHIQRG